MRRNYKKALAFILTLLLVFGSMSVAYAGNGPRVEMKDVPSNITGITMNFYAQGTVKVGKDMVPTGDQFPLHVELI